MLVTVAVWYGIAWDNKAAYLMYVVTHMISVGTSGLGFTLFGNLYKYYHLIIYIILKSNYVIAGKTFLMTFYKSGNRAPDSLVLPLKVLFFAKYIYIYIYINCFF